MFTNITELNIFGKKVKLVIHQNYIVNITNGYDENSPFSYFADIKKLYEMLSQIKQMFKYEIKLHVGARSFKPKQFTINTSKLAEIKHYEVSGQSAMYITSYENFSGLVERGAFIPDVPFIIHYKLYDAQIFSAILAELLA